MNKSANENSDSNKTPIGSAKRLEEVLDNLDLQSLSAPLLRTLLSQTIETLKVARHRVDEQKQHIELLGRLSNTDPRTGLHNRRGLQAALRQALARAKREQSGGALIVIDLDGFKAINQTYGHAAGDSVIDSVARHLVNAVREGDEVARLGSNEFAILMHGISYREADIRAAAISTSLNDLVVHWNGRSVQVRGSVGGACYGPEDKIDSIYKRADENMVRRESERMPIRTSGGKHDA